MKKVLVLIISILFMTSGCGKVTKESVAKDFTGDVNGSKSYKLKGSMEIVNNEETFVYSLETYYLKDDYYKVILVNQTNNHEQIILRNPDGVYVVTPSLNKSFKFQSEWPFNSSQSYILASLVNDVKNDKNYSMEETENNYVLKSSVNYPNNSELVSQKIFFDKKMNLESVEVYNKDNIVKIKVSFTSVDLKANLDKDDFVLEDLIDEDCCAQNNCSDNKCEENDEQIQNEESNSESTSSLENIIYPLYIPSNTHLQSSEKIDTDSGERAILTFSGEKDFILIEETVVNNEEFEVIPVYGDPMLVTDSIAAISGNSISWTTNEMEYYIASNDLSQEEMVTIASSLNSTSYVMESK